MIKAPCYLTAEGIFARQGTGRDGKARRGMGSGGCAGGPRCRKGGAWREQNPSLPFCLFTLFCLHELNPCWRSEVYLTSGPVSVKSRIFLGVREVTRFARAHLLGEALHISFFFNAYTDLARRDQYKSCVFLLAYCNNKMTLWYHSSVSQNQGKHLTNTSFHQNI